MRYLAIIIVVLLCAVSLESQISPGALHRLIGNPSTTSGWTDPSGAGKLRDWWVASDLTNSPVSTWTNRITIGSVLRTNGVNQVTWSTDHVIINGLYPSLLFDPTLDFRPHLSTTNSGHCLGVVFYQYQSATTGEILASTNGQDVVDVLSDGVSFRWCGAVTATIVKSNIMDFFYNSDGQCYTNGVAVGTPFDATQKGLGLIGRLKGYIYEIPIWTNGPLTSGQISNYHHYATNTYHFSP